SSSVSCMSAARHRISGAVGSATGSAFRWSTGFPIFAMRSTAMQLFWQLARILRRRRARRLGAARRARGDALIAQAVVARHARELGAAAEGAIAVALRALGRRRRLLDICACFIARCRIDRARLAEAGSLRE